MQAMVRVELHNATSVMYQLLHTAMEAAGFSRTLTDSGGKLSHMPTGTYWTGMDAAPNAIFEAARNAALSVESAAEIVVSANGEILYFQCRPVLQPAGPKPLMSLPRIGASSFVPVPAGIGSIFSGGPAPAGKGSSVFGSHYGNLLDAK